MKPIEGAPLPDFSSLLKVGDMEWFEGPLLSHYISSDKEDFVFYWADLGQNSGFERWIVIPTTEYLIDIYLDKRITLRDFMLKALGGIAYSVEIDKFSNYVNSFAFYIHAIDPDYLPEAGLYHDFESRNYSRTMYLSKKNEIGILELNITGDNIKRGVISLSQFNGILGKIETLINKIASEYIENNLNIYYNENEINPATRNTLFNKSHFEVLATAPGSFKIYLKPISKQIQISGNHEFTDEFTSEFLNLLSSGIYNDINIFKHYDNSYKVDILSNYLNFAKYLTSSKVNIDFSWFNSNTKFRESKQITMENCNKIIQNVIAYKTRDSRKFTASGYFTSLNVKTGQFTFNLDDENAYKGRYVENDKSPLKQIQFDKNYSASLESIYDKNGDEKIILRGFDIYDSK
ncbi:MAG: hypothetical protein LBU81_00910 [Methanosarcinales archaeon]|jgi:hypothetical protein|nr:hypothetical protein [Methanosarcinales archaeon]